MKNIVIKSAAFVLMTSSLISCSKLDENPKTSIDAANFYHTQSDAVAAVTAAYSTLSTDINADFPIYGRDLNLLIDNTGDNQVYSPSNTNPDVRALGTATYISSNDRVHKIYAQLYWGIDKANIAIDNIPNIAPTQFVDPTHNALNLVREARFIRALYYFNLVRMFGAVPLVLHDAGSVEAAAELVSRAPKDSVYTQIIIDLDSASNLPATYGAADLGRATAGAAHALLAKVYATRHDWTNAETQILATLSPSAAFTSAIPTGAYGYDLFPQFSHVFQTPYKNGIEHIFSAQFKYNGGSVNSTQNLSSGDFSTFSTTTYTGDIPSDTTVVNLFDIADQRRKVTFYDSLKNGAAWVKWPYFNFAKYIDSTVSPITSQALSGVNFPVIRYSEILLLQAEVLNELNGGPTADAYAAINIVRGRAYGTYTGGGNYSDHTHDLTPALSQADFRDSVYLERRKEFIQESQRWFDLVRRSGQDGLPAGQYYLNAVHGMLNNPKAAATLKDTLFPIPQTEIDLYAGQNPNFYQNPGW
ncbi:MAG TPA: RagB/SusD family nutrient uptake outer membrane protein [Ferruginibacter sp.]|nr:RagB/SusD family nutrient uptake outer membrane protein [Ferruginibacter sp.]